MLTFYADGGDRTHIALYTNEKKNALAPKITGQGAEGVSSEISDTFAQTLGDVALGLVSSLSDYLTDEDTQAALTRVEARLGSVGDQLRSGAHTADTFTALLEGSRPLLDSASALVDTAGDAFTDTSGALGSGVRRREHAEVHSADGGTVTRRCPRGDLEQLRRRGQRIDGLYAAGDTLSGAQVQAITTLAERVQQQADQYAALKNTLRPRSDRTCQNPRNPTSTP